MALSSCPECGVEISTEAMKCPHCGIENPWGKNVEEQAVPKQKSESSKASPEPSKDFKIYQIGQPKRTVGCGEAVTSLGVIMTICFTIPFLIFLFTGL